MPTTPAQGRPGRNTGGTFDACVAYVDTLVGRLVATLDELHLRDNTVILFAGENADARADKTCATERMVRDARWMLEAAAPVGGQPEGRLYDYGRTPRVQIDLRSASAEASAARRRLQVILAGIPYLDCGNVAHAAALQRYSAAPFPHKLDDRPVEPSRAPP